MARRGDGVARRGDPALSEPRPVTGDGPPSSAPAHRPARSRTLRVLRAAGAILLAVGILLLLFTAYQLWGTGLTESHSQSALRARLDRQLPRGAAATARRLGAARHPTTKPSKRPSADGGPPSVAPSTPTPALNQPVGEIDIPSIDLDQVIVQGVTATQLRMGPGHYPGTPLPGEAGNVAIAGHRTTYAHPFYSLTAVAPGALIEITTPQGVFDYVAQGQTVVAPTDVAVVGPSSGATLTLTTCNPRYSAATRLVLHAVLQRSMLFSNAASSSPTTTTTAPKPHRHRPTTAADLSGTGSGGSWLVALGWGAAVLVAAAGTWLVAHRLRRRWTAYLPGTVVVLVVLFFFFGALSALLPASF